MAVINFMVCLSPSSIENVYVFFEANICCQPEIPAFIYSLCLCVCVCWLVVLFYFIFCSSEEFIFRKNKPNKLSFHDARCMQMQIRQACVIKASILQLRLRADTDERDECTYSNAKTKLNRLRLMRKTENVNCICASNQIIQH